LFCYEDFPGRVMRVMKECFRVLKDGGVMLSISHGREKARKFFYRNRLAPFTLRVVKLGENKPGQPTLYLYVMIKGESTFAEGDN
jgi:ubiquinone/menaquinone biosynthesis C-methylase UbiE